MAAVLEKTDCALLEEAGEFIAAGFMERPEASPLWRVCRGLQRYFTRCPLPRYEGEALYPCTESFYALPQALSFHYSQALCLNLPLLDQKIAAAANEDIQAALQQLRDEMRDYPMVMGYTHSIINFGRILREGLETYEARIEGHLQRAQGRGETDKVEFYEALLLLLDGLRELHRRCCEMLEADGRPEAGRVAAALREAPWQPARSFYEAMVATNFLYFVDGTDDLGRFDQDLWPYYRDSLAAGEHTREEALAWVRQQWTNVDLHSGWNVALGGTAPDGGQGCNGLTLVCLEAAKGRRRPNLALRLRQDTPEEYWDQALDTISGGTGIPALYNEEEYLRGLQEAHLGVAAADLPYFAFGGCTELMVHGRSNVGSLDDTLNVLQVLEGSLYRRLPHCYSFGELLHGVKEDLTAAVRELTQRVNGYQETKAQWQPQPIRTLLVDDCIDNAREFNQGGARYNWSVINLAGLPNLYDSLAAVREVVFDKQEASAGQLLEALRCDFVGYEDLQRRLSKCPKYGNDDAAVDDLAAELSEHIFRDFQRQACWRGGRYLASCLMFVTYAYFGEMVGATPDGRRANAPVGDSAGAYQGRDCSGPTALLRSMTRVPHYLAPGTLVHNIRFTKRLFNDPEARRQLKSLVRTYFGLGGMQIQINVVDQAILQDALEHPERHRDLIVRMGGYSEYFHNLTRELQLSVLERTEHES